MRLVLARGGYFAIFLMTPMDLFSRLTTTVFRFFGQVYPALFFAYFLLLRPAEEASLRPMAAGAGHESA